MRVPGLEPGTSPLSGVRSKPTELHAHIAYNNKKDINNQPGRTKKRLDKVSCINSPFEGLLTNYGLNRKIMAACQRLKKSCQNLLVFLPKRLKTLIRFL